MQKLVFVLATNPGDRAWTQEVFKAHPNVILTNVVFSSLDLAILSMCNHTIYDYGTFGMWYRHFKHIFRRRFKFL